MANNFHDIIPPERRSIRNVTTTHRHPRRAARRPTEETLEHPPPQDPGKRRRLPAFFSRWGLWVVAIIAIVIFVLAFSLLFSGSKIAVTPKQREAFIDGQFEAFRNAAAGQLAYEIVSVEQTVSKEVPATGEEEVEERASGRIIIFNNFDEQGQRLITNTRFETPDGLIYRIDEPVVVPGQQTEDGEVIPGKIEVTVYADEPGERYNIGLTDFTIPGFAGGPRFEAFYARSKTPMTGGFSGTRMVADETEAAAAKAELRARLKRELEEKIKAEVPIGFHLFNDAMFVTYESLPSTGEGDSVEINEKGTLHALLFRREDLARFIAVNTIAGYEQEPIDVLDPDSLSFSISDREDVQPWVDDSIAFSLSGKAHMVWLYDEDRLLADLAGRSKDALPTILSGYPSIQEAEVSLRPFWRQTFPEDTADITIERVLETAQ